MTNARAHTINMLRDLARAFHHNQQDQAQELLDALEPLASNGLPSAAQLAAVALESLDAWYARNGLSTVRFVHRDIPRSLQKVTTAVDALASKGRAMRSANSLLQRNPERTVAGAGAYLVANALDTLATQRDIAFDEVLQELLPKQAVDEPTPSTAAAAAPVDSELHEVIEIVDETVEPDNPSSDDPAARYTAVVETRFMAGVKEFFQWMGESQAVTGTGMPKRADIKDVAATINIDAEGVAKKPAGDESAASDVDLTIPAEPRATRFVTSAQAIPELMAFWTTLQETGLVEISGTKIQPAKDAPTFGFEDFEHLEAAEDLVATYVYKTLTTDAATSAATDTATWLIEPERLEDTVGTLVPRLRQLESVGLIEIVDGQPVIAAALRPAISAGAARVTA